jgi:hypothetical protein
VDARVRYAAQAAGVRFSFTQKEAVFGFTKGNKAVTLRLAFLGANPATTVRGRRLGAGKVNYLLGRDPARWHTGLPTYGQVVYRDLWPGVDMVFGGAAGRLKYEFLLRPGAEVQHIRLAYRGARGVSVDKAGSLQIRTALGVLTDTRPRSYQAIGGRRVPVDSRFALGGKPATAFGFAVGHYDRRQPLVIDPGLAYSTFLGGSGLDGGAIAVDAAGNAHLAGQTSSADFPTSAGVLDAGLSGNYDAFVAKLNPAGSALLYATFLGGSSNDAANGIRLDASGDAYLTGSTISADFPTSPGAFDTSYNGGTDAFVAKLNPAGSALLYSTLLGGSGYNPGYGIALDAAGDAYVTGAPTPRTSPPPWAPSTLASTAASGTRSWPSSTRAARRSCTRPSWADPATTKGAGSRWTPPVTRTCPGAPTRRTSPPAWAPSTPATTAAWTRSWPSSTRAARRCCTRPSWAAPATTRASGSRWTPAATPTCPG